METLYIVIPAYNEEANIQRVLDEWYPIVEEHHGNGSSRLCVLDDGSRDDTFRIMEAYAKTHPLFEAITKPNEGHGATVLYGYHYALEHGADYIFQTDSDGQTVPAEFAAFWEKRREYDAIVGCRRKREDGLSRIFVTKVLKVVIRLTFGVEVADANTPFRLMKRELLQKYIGQIPDKFNLSNVLLTVFFVKGNEKLLFLPISFRPRQGGKNSINLKSISRIGMQAVKDFRQINRTLGRKS